MFYPDCLLKKLLLVVSALHLALNCFSQKTDTTKRELIITGNFSAANNGISLIPTFTLGKSAFTSYIDFAGKKRFSFVSEFLYSIEDFRPWSIAFFSRYKIVQRKKFQLTAGAHIPVLNFVTSTVIKDGIEQEIIHARRFFPNLELIPNYQVSKNFRLEMYLFFGNGIDRDADFHGYFLSLRPSFDYIPISGKSFLRFYPQLYYLWIADQDGIYTAGTLALGRKNFPFSLSTTLYRSITSNLSAKPFDWNIAINYSFARNYVGK